MKTSFFAAVALAGAAVTSQAQAGPRSWISNTGTDSGTCPAVTPCHTLQYAHDHTDAGGEIDVKDSGGYGPLVATKSMSVVAPDGVLATITLAAAGVAIDLRQIAASDFVLVRGLTINGVGVINNSNAVGVAINNGKVNIDHCTIKGLFAAITINNNAVSLITNNTLVNNFDGLVISAGSSTGVGGNIIANNTYGIANFVSSAYSYGDNKINANSSADFYGNQVPVGGMR